MNFLEDMKKLGFIIIGNYLLKEDFREMEENNNDIEELIVEDVLQAVSEFIKQGNKSVIQFVRDLVQKGCLDGKD